MRKGSGVYIQPFPATGQQYHPKEYNDFHPTWSASSAELFYVPEAGRFSVIGVHTSRSLTFDKPVSAPTPTRDRVASDVRDYEVMPDGRFLSTVPAEDDLGSATTGASQIRVVLDWFRELQQRVP
jgi:hypothetical protein